MDKLKTKAANLRRRQTRVRAKISGTTQIPRLRVTRSNANIYAQLIDDTTGRTLVSASSLDADFKKSGKNGATVAGATEVGEIVGKRAKDAKIAKVVFDRGGRIYHGRVKALADGARSAGLEF
jgi:large subunit ribosomal protein L18